MTIKRHPSLRLHKPSSRAIVKLDGKIHYCGVWDTDRNQPSEDARKEYDRILSVWLANARSIPEPQPTEGGTVEDLIATYWLHAQDYYRLADGSPSNELQNIRYALRPLRKLYGSTAASAFDALALEAVQLHLAQQEYGHKRDKETGELVPDTGKRLSRTTVNSRINIIRRVFAWGESKKLVPPGTAQHLATLPNLKRGRSKAREPEAKEPVPWAWVEASLPHLPKPLQAAVLLQWWTGMRPGEVLQLTIRQVEIGQGTWFYRPQRHKTSWRGRERLVTFGPRAREILRPLLKADPDAPVISPRDALEAKWTAMRAARKTPLTPSQRQRDAAGRRTRLQRVSDRYDVNGYRTAIHRACEAANVPAWSPHQLRHAAATRLLPEVGEERTRAALGWSRTDMLKVYASRADRVLAEDAMEEHG